MLAGSQDVKVHALDQGLTLPNISSRLDRPDRKAPKLGLLRPRHLYAIAPRHLGLPDRTHHGAELVGLKREGVVGTWKAVINSEVLFYNGGTECHCGHRSHNRI